MNKLFLTAAMLGLFASAAAIPQPAMAQGTDGPIQRHEGKGGCPWGWSAGRGGSQSELQCHKGSSGSPAYYNPSRKPCAANYISGPGSSSYYCWELSGEQADQRSAADKLVSYGTITKANKLDRCPLGYFSKADMTICTTTLSPAPKARKKVGACRANEIDEWGIYCTADAKVISRKQAEDEATRDFNAIYTSNGANLPAQGGDTENYPSMVAAYGPKGARGAAASSSSSNSQSASNDAAAANTNCPTPSSTGATLGGAIGGDAGAALGSMLGGFGKEKKKAGC